MGHEAQSPVIGYSAHTAAGSLRSAYQTRELDARTKLPVITGGISIDVIGCRGTGYFRIGAAQCWGTETYWQP